VCERETDSTISHIEDGVCVCVCVCPEIIRRHNKGTTRFFVRCSVMQCVAVCYRVLQCVVNDSF